MELELRSVGFCGTRKTGERREKPSEQGENQQQSQPTYDAGSENQTQTTLVGGERSHHCTIPAPLTGFFSSYSAVMEGVTLRNSPCTNFHMAAWQLMVDFTAHISDESV